MSRSGSFRAQRDRKRRKANMEGRAARSVQGKPEHSGGTGVSERAARIIGILFYTWMAAGLTLMLTVGVPEWLGFSNALFLVFYAFYAFSLLHLTTPGTDPAAKPLPVGIRTYPRPLLRLVLGAAGIWLGGMAVEWSGVHTGWPFGGYHYSWILGPHLFGVPITLGFAWIAVIGSSALIAGPAHPSLIGRLWKAIQVGVWTVLIDFVLDPAAASRGFWTWSGSGGFYGIPWSNFASWFVVGSLLSLLLPDRLPSRRTRLLGLRLYQLILLMFGLIALQDGIYGPAGIALAGIGLSEARFRYDTRRTLPGVSRFVRSL